MTVKDTPKTIRGTLLFYLRINRNRMDSDQQEELDRIIKCAKLRENGLKSL